MKQLRGRQWYFVFVQVMHVLHILLTTTYDSPASLRRKKEKKPVQNPSDQNSDLQITISFAFACCAFKNKPL